VSSQALLVKIVTEIIFGQCTCSKRNQTTVLAADHRPANTKNRQRPRLHWGVVPESGTPGVWKKVLFWTPMCVCVCVCVCRKKFLGGYCFFEFQLTSWIQSLGGLAFQLLGSLRASPASTTALLRRYAVSPQPSPIITLHVHRGGGAAGMKF